MTLQLGLLELNAGIGRSLEREGLLQRENAALSIEDSELAAGNRVESRATAIGMELVPIAALRFLTARPGIDATRAAGALRTPAQAPSTAPGEAGTEAAADTPATSVAAPGGEQAAPTAASTPAATSVAAPAGEQAKTPSEAGESGGPSPGAAAAATPETAAPGQSPAPSSSQPAPAGGGSAEASPAGGTQAGPTG